MRCARLPGFRTFPSVPWLRFPARVALDGDRSPCRPPEAGRTDGLRICLGWSHRARAGRSSTRADPGAHHRQYLGVAGRSPPGPALLGAHGRTAQPAARGAPEPHAPAVPAAEPEAPAADRCRASGVRGPVAPGRETRAHGLPTGARDWQALPAGGGGQPTETDRETGTHPLAGFGPRLWHRRVGALAGAVPGGADDDPGARRPVRRRGRARRRGVGDRRLVGRESRTRAPADRVRLERAAGAPGARGTRPSPP